MQAYFNRVLFSSRANFRESPSYLPAKTRCDRNIGDRYLVRLHGASRTRFRECLFYGLGFDSTSQESKNHHGGAALRICESGGITLTDCHTVDAGAMLDVELSGEITVANCRSEGAYGRPAWRFREAGNVTLINPANEGRLFNPALFEFTHCRDVILINPQIAGPELPIEGSKEGGRYPDGILFDTCENCSVIGGTVAPAYVTRGQSFRDKGDGTARLIRVRESRYITGNHIPTLLQGRPELDVSIEGDSRHCRFELWGQDKDVRRTVEVSSTVR
jgi:hypothetical protein